MRVGIVGCGAIGSTIARAIAGGVVKAQLVALLDMYPEKCRDSASLTGAMICRDISCLLNTNIELVVEAASQSAVKDIVPELLRRGVNVVLLSVGALLDKETYDKVLSAAKSSGAIVYIPSGAIGGVDAVKALSLSNISKVVLRTSKSYKALGLREEEGDKLLFKGPASEAVKKYPANINVAATLTLASGVEAEVEIWAKRELDANIHEIEVLSDASRLYVRVENKPHPHNPKTSYLAVLSAIRLLKQVCEGGILIGT